MNVKLSLAKMVEYVQTLSQTIPVSAQVNSWEEIVNTVSICTCLCVCNFICIASIYNGIWAEISVISFQSL